MILLHQKKSFLRIVLLSQIILAIISVKFVVEAADWIGAPDGAIPPEENRGPIVGPRGLQGPAGLIGPAGDITGDGINWLKVYALEVTNKLTVQTIDPVFEIQGEKYATYVADFAGGTRMETSDTIEIEENYIIDFDSLEKGSDLWLFWQGSNKDLDDVVVLLTAGFNGNVWYEKIGNVLIISTDQPGSVSYRFSAPRVDYEKWPNFLEDQTIEGIKVID